MTPLDTTIAIAFLEDVARGIAQTELEAILDVTGPVDAEFTIEQYSLAATVAEAVTPGTDARLVTAAAAIPDPHSLVRAAHACVNRLLNDPYSSLWRSQPDGGIEARRRARVLRARLHRACGS